MTERHHDVRRECYEAVRDCFTRGVSAYYRKHPNRLDDERSVEAVAISKRGLESIFAVLDEYVISKRPDEGDGQRSD